MFLYDAEKLHVLRDVTKTVHVDGFEPKEPSLRIRWVDQATGDFEISLLWS